MNPKSRPMLFKTEMVQAILAGTKTQTRRLLKMPPKKLEHNSITNAYIGESGREYKCPYGQVGDIIWVRETFQETTFLHVSDENYGYIYKASENGREWEANDESWKWKPSLFMPKKAARIFLEITDIRAERLNDISEGDAIAEGIGRWTEERMTSKPIRYQIYQSKKGDDSLYFSNPINSYESLWESINGKGSWENNPYVWVITFKTKTV